MIKVKINWKKCKGSGTCKEVCPVNVFELHNIQEYQNTVKAVPIKENNCINCCICTNLCPTQSITVVEE